MKQTFVLIGNFGSGKTEISLNMAFQGAKKHQTALVDLDIINPYFRSAERKSELVKAGIKLLYPIYALSTVDVPSLPPDIYSVFIDDSKTVIFDVGGDPTGATALGQYKANFESLTGELSVLYVVNPRRPLSKTPELILDMIDRIKYRSRLSIDGFINNCNLQMETTADDIMEGYEVLKEVSIKTDIPVLYTAGVKKPLDDFLKKAEQTGLDNKYIGQPFVLTRYMHRDWETFTEQGL